mgnify:CR=1 FL=1
MKYFIKRDVCADFGAFEIYDETGIEKYLAEFSKSKRSRKIIIHSADEIFVKMLVGVKHYCLQYKRRR